MHIVTIVSGESVINGPAGGRLDGMVAELGKRGKGTAAWSKASRKVGHHWHIRKIEAARGARLGVVSVHRKMAIAIGVGAGGGNVRGVKDVGVDKGELVGYLAKTHGEITREK